MFVLEADTTRQLLVLSFSGKVTLDESRETVALQQLHAVTLARQPGCGGRAGPVPVTEKSY